MGIVDSISCCCSALHVLYATEGSSNGSSCSICDSDEMLIGLFGREKEFFKVGLRVSQRRDAVNKETAPFQWTTQGESQTSCLFENSALRFHGIVEGREVK